MKQKFLFLIISLELFLKSLSNPFSYDFSNRAKGSIQTSGNLSVSGNFTNSDFTADDFFVSNQLNSSYKMSSDDLRYANGYVEDLYTDVIEGLNGSIVIEGDLYLSSFATEIIEAQSFIVEDVRQWELSRHDDFDKMESLIGWSMNKTSECANHPKNRFLGGHCILSSDEITKHYENLPKHNTIKLNANIHLFDNWEGESVYLKIDDEMVWFKSVKASKSEHSFNICGGEASDPKFAMPLDYIMQHTSPIIKVTFGSTLKKDSCEASFAIDDVMIYLK